MFDYNVRLTCVSVLTYNFQKQLRASEESCHHGPPIIELLSDLQRTVAHLRAKQCKRSLAADISRAFFEVAFRVFRSTKLRRTFVDTLYKQCTLLTSCAPSVAMTAKSC